MAENKSKTKWHTLDTTLYYAKVFEKNRDTNDMHSASNGVTSVSMILTDEQIQELMDLGIPKSALGYETFKKKDFAGDDWVYTAKRPWTHKYLKEDDGSPVHMGEPEVFDYNKALAKWSEAGATGSLRDHIEQWSMVNDGLIGNGTKAKVKLSIYNGKNKAGKPTNVTTLESIAITDLVVYESSTGDDGPRW